MSAERIVGGSIARGLGSAGSFRWPLRRSSELFELRYGKSLVESIRMPGEVPVFGTNGQTGTNNKPLFDGPGVIIGRKGAGHLGVHWSEGAFWVIDTAYSLVPTDEVDLRFAYYLIKHVGLNHLKHGTSNPSLTRDAFGGQYFPIPPLDAQRAIAATLTSLDDKIEVNGSAIGRCEEVIDAIAEFYAAELATTTLSALAALARETVDPSGLGDREVDHYSLPAFDVGVRPDRTRASSIKSNKQEIPESSVLVSRLNPRIERMWWATPSGDVPAMASTEFAVLTSHDEVTLAGVWLAVRSPDFRGEFPRRVTGTSGSHQRVRPADMMQLQVPDVRALNSDVKVATLDLLRNAHQLRRESAALGALRDSLLPELLSGRIQVPHAGEVTQGEAHDLGET